MSDGWCRLGGVRRIVVRRHGSALGAWEMASAPAGPHLRELVHSYVGYTERTVAPLRRREVPSGFITLIISFGDPMRVTIGPGQTVTSFVAGLHEQPAITEHAGRQQGIEIRLTPLGGYALLHTPMHLLANTVVDLPALVGGSLVDRLACAPDWAARFALLDTALAGLLDAGRPAAPEVAWAWHRLRASAGRISVADLTGEVGWSRRHLAARFREQVGLTPKAAARVLRFERALGLLRPGSSLAGVAVAAGFYDQAHLHRDFRALAGCTPTEYLAAQLPDGGGTGA
jgi:AraC-like DNA-binding protein